MRRIVPRIGKARGVKMTDPEMVQALCQALEDAGAGTWDPAGGAYTPTSTGIYYGTIGSATERGIGVTRYDRADFGQRRDEVKTRRVQVRVRGPKNSPRAADELAETVDAALISLSRTAGINNVDRVSGPLPLGTDGNGRSELSLNYSVTLED